MEKGIVTWFNDAKGFGFVRTDQGDEIICDKQHLITEPKTMKELQEIWFQRISVNGRDHATSISVIRNDAIAKPILSMKNCKVYSTTPFIAVFEDVASMDMCQEIINKHIVDGMNPNSGGQSRQESYTQVTEEVENRGISLGMDPHHYNIIARSIVDNIGIPYSYIEAIDIYNYEVGQFLDLHHDYPYDPKQINYYSHGGDRVGTGILYLNDNFDGGVTSFPKLGIHIEPKAGSLLYFKQGYEDEAVNWSTIHESALITKGTKWVASCFFSASERIGFTDREEFVPQDNPQLRNEFYIKKFMDIQRGNIQLYRKLKNLETSSLKIKVEEVLGVDFFKNIDDLVK